MTLLASKLPEGLRFTSEEVSHKSKRTGSRWCFASHVAAERYTAAQTRMVAAKLLDEVGLLGQNFAAKEETDPAVIAVSQPMYRLRDYVEHAISPLAFGETLKINWRLKTIELVTAAANGAATSAATQASSQLATLTADGIKCSQCLLQKTAGVTQEAHSIAFKNLIGTTPHDWYKIEIKLNSF